MSSGVSANLQFRGQRSAQQAAKGQSPAFQIYITVDGTDQGQFSEPNTSGSVSSQFGDTALGALKFSYGVTSPINVSTGQPSGECKHKPIVITREPGAASPRFFKALVTHEKLNSVVIKFLPGNVATGANEVQQRITLTNAFISDFLQYVGDDGRWLEDVAFTFQVIKIDNKPDQQNHTTAVDYLGTHN